MMLGHQGDSHYNLSLSRLSTSHWIAAQRCLQPFAEGLEVHRLTANWSSISSSANDMIKRGLQWSIIVLNMSVGGTKPATTRLLTRSHAASCFLHPGSLLPAPHSCREATLFQKGNSYTAWQDRAYNFVCVCVLPQCISRCIVPVFLSLDDRLVGAGVLQTIQTRDDTRPRPFHPSIAVVS